MKRALLCGCRRRLEASDEEKLVNEVLAHLRQEHPAEGYGEARVRERVAAHSYRYESVEVYAGGAEADEEFSLEPY
jgi:Protein of unknown function (DUF1059)